jgi:hypothetical protein
LASTDVGRSLAAVADLLDWTGKSQEAEATYRKAETLLVELAPPATESATRAALADCRSHLGSWAPRWAKETPLDIAAHSRANDLVDWLRGQGARSAKETS